MSGEYTNAQKAAIYKHLKKIETLRFTVPRGEGAAIKDHAKAQGESLNAFVNRAVKDTMQRDSLQPDSKPDI